MRMTGMIDAEIARRSARAKRLAALFADLPKEMSYTEFLLHPDIEALELDFVTSSEMFDAYQKQERGEI